MKPPATAIGAGEKSRLCCKNGWEPARTGSGFSLSGDSKETFHESHLSLNVTFVHSENLPCSNDVYRLLSLDRQSCRPEAEASESGIDSSLRTPRYQGSLMKKLFKTITIVVVLNEPGQAASSALEIRSLAVI